ncbi:MAG: sigma-70 family RNA polymerase sigma factor, partial [Clostridia bacterium]|nr:sigma-70 family RNA polymerase sigma factor [Clostridia bacterium]
SILELKGDGGIEEGLVESIDLRYALDTLDELTRQVIFLRYYKGFTQQKTGEVLGLRQVRVSRLERKALGLLRDRLSLQHI